ncbi:MAG: trigger factor [Candidatus Acidiferrales bacterium]
MTEATCKRELELEIPAEDVQKTTEKIARDLARVARIPGFRPGKAPVTLIRRRFAEEIKGEVLESLVPEFLGKALDEKKLTPVTRPALDKVDFADGGALKFRATFEILPEFELGAYNEMEISVEEIEVGEAQVTEALETMRERAATFVPVEGRAAQDGDYVLLKLLGAPAGGGDPIQANDVLCHIGAEETLAAFNENLCGAKPGETREFDATYPADYPDAKLAGKTYKYSVEVRGVKEKRLPELNDDFAKELGGGASEIAKTLEELKTKIRENLDAAREEREKQQAREKILEALVKQNDFPVPDALVEQQMDVRLERAVRALASQGVDPRAVNVDWVSLRKRQHDRAVDDVKAEILLDRIASAEKIEVSDADLDQEIAQAAERSGESATALRARLTKQGALDRMKSKLRSDKTVEWLYRTARIQKTAKSEKK